MKKILFGLVAMSMMTYAAAPTLTNPATENTNVFQTGQSGQIAVKGNLSSNVPQIKYVVYASLDGTYDATSGEVWELPTWTTEAFEGYIAPSYSTELGFGGQPVPKLYVKRVNGADNGTIELTSETVSYKLLLDPAFGFTNTDVIKDFSSTFSKTQFSIWSFMSYAQLEDIFAKAGLSSVLNIYTDSSSISAIAYPQKNGTDAWYYGGTLINFERESLGVLKIYDDQNYLGIDSNFDSANGQAIDKVLATEHTGNPNLAILVKVQ